MMAGYLRKEWRKTKRHYRPLNLLEAVLFNGTRPTLKGLLGNQKQASWKRDPATGQIISTSGLRRTKNGLEMKSRTKRKTRTKPNRVKARADQRAADRARRNRRQPVRSKPHGRQDIQVALNCDACRGTRWRPEFIGDGRIKTVIGVRRCNHASVGGQQNPEPGDLFVCIGCQNTGRVPDSAKRGRKAAVSTKPCPTCRGWIGKWTSAFE